METQEIIMWLLGLFASGVLACWIAYSSTVVQKIKAMLWLHAEQKLPKWKTWFKPIGWCFEELRELLNCPYCISFWLGLLWNLQFQAFSTWQSVIYACLSIVFVEVYRKLSL